MKIFYGIQGTGNGHIARGRVMAKALSAAGIEVKYQFSGRPADKYFDMEIFNDYQLREGFTFNTSKGHINHLQTIFSIQAQTFLKEIKELDLSSYDLVICDFDPVTAWAAKRQKKTVLGIGHQYAFAHKIPKYGADIVGELVIKNFAPAVQSIGLHWHDFGQPILPPIIETPAPAPQPIKNKIVVYLLFEDPQQVINYLAPFTEFNFHYYCTEAVSSPFAHIVCKPLARESFQQDLRDCEGIISNAGFELPSEAL